jgi:hypothetical protein
MDSCSPRKGAKKTVQPRLARLTPGNVVEGEHPDAAWPRAAFRAQLAKRVEGEDDEVRNESCFKVSGISSSQRCPDLESLDFAEDLPDCEAEEGRSMDADLSRDMIPHLSVQGSSELRQIPRNCPVQKDTESSQRKRQFRFNTESEMTLLRTVCALTPWEAAYGKTLSVWGQIATVLQSSGLNVDGKRARAKFDSLIKEWRERVAKEEKQSGINVEYGEKEILLEDIKSAMEEWSTHGQEALEISKSAKQKADAQGKDIRDASLSRLRKKRDRVSEDGSDVPEIQSSSKPRRSAATITQFEEAFVELSESYVKNQQDSRMKQKELDIQERKLALEEKRLALEMEDRSAARQSQEATMNAMLGIIAKFAEKTSK